MAHDEDFIRRFLDEARVVTTLSHGNIAHVYEVGREGDEFFLAMEYVDGRDLRQILARCFERKVRIPQELGLYIVKELLRGLSYAHRKEDANGKPLGLIHRDVCPQNVMISFEGEVKLIDFGLAKSALRSLSTNPSILLGKVAYMSPEQARREKLDSRSDLYSAGIVLYEVLTGRRRYGDAKGHELLKIVREPGELVFPPDIKIHPAIESTLRKALAPRIEDRYQSAEEFRKDITSALASLGQIVEPERLGEFVKNLFPPKPAPAPKAEVPRSKEPPAPPRAPAEPQAPKPQAALIAPTDPHIPTLPVKEATSSSPEPEEEAPLLEEAPVTEVKPNPIPPEPDPVPEPSVEISPALLAPPAPEPQPMKPPAPEPEPVAPPPPAQAPAPAARAAPAPQPVYVLPAPVLEPADLLAESEEEEDSEDFELPGGATEVVPYPQPSSRRRANRGARILLVALFGFVLIIILGAGALFAVDPEGFRAWLKKNLNVQQSILPPPTSEATSASTPTSAPTSEATSLTSLPTTTSTMPLEEGPAAAQEAQKALDEALLQKGLLIQDVTGLTRVYRDIHERGEQNDLEGLKRGKEEGEKLIASTSLNARLVKKKEERLLKEVRAQKLEKKGEVSKLLKQIKREKSIVRKNNLLNELNSHLTSSKEEDKKPG